jgi:hypothetical protein
MSYTTKMKMYLTPCVVNDVYYLRNKINSYKAVILHFDFEFIILILKNKVPNLIYQSIIQSPQLSFYYKRGWCHNIISGKFSR